MPKVSVIIPIFGVEKYIERCARSLFEQTLDEIEFVFVNDCTTDNSITILLRVIEEYKSYIKIKKSVIKFVQTPINSGLPIARQYGLKQCTGEYIAHCDSDDWVEVNMYEKMYYAAKLNNADVAICGYYTTDDSSCKIEHKVNHTSSAEELLYETIEAKSIWSVWNKLFKREIYENNIEYPDKTNGEDLALVSQLLSYSKRVAYVTIPLYNYFSNSRSITRLNNNEAAIKRFKEANDNIEIAFKNINKKLSARRVHNAYICLKFKQILFLSSFIRNNDIRNIWMKAANEILFKIIFNPLITKHDKIKFYLIEFKLFGHILKP